jgi:hypothetical protein
MAQITIARTDDPSITRKVGEESFRRWPKGTAPGTKEGGRYDWVQVDESLPPAEPRKPRVPDVITQVMGAKADKAKTDPEPVKEPLTAAEVVAKIEGAKTAEAVDALIQGDERKTVIAAADKRKSQLARQ